MLKNVVVLLVSLLLTACTSKEEKALIHVYEKNKTYHKQLQKTQTTQLKVDGITKVLLSATYLYASKQKTSEDEVFIIGMYSEESEIQSFTQESFALTLDDGEGHNFKPKSVDALKKDSPYLKDISFVFKWNQFYLVHFPHTDKKSFMLTLKSTRYGEGSLHFAKVAKYTLPNTTF